MPARWIAGYFGTVPPSDEVLADWGSTIFQFLFTDLNNDPAVDAAGTQQSATFSGAVFAFHEPSAAHSITRLKLQGGDFSVCKTAPPATAHGARAVAAARTKPVRQLFGSGHGRFRTEGRFAAATVHGTIWVTKDYCDRTVVTVKRGVVGVTDLKTGKVVSVHAGSSRTILRR